MPTIEELRADLENTDQALRTERYKGGDASQAEITRLELKYQELQAQINQAEVEGVTQQIAPSADVIEVNGETYSIDELAADPPSAIVLRQDRRQTKAQVAEQASKWVNDVQRLRDEYEAKLAEQATANQALIAQVDALQAEVGQLTLERDDALEKRDAAVRQAEEAQAIIAQKDSHLDDLRAQIALGTQQAIKVVDIESPEQLAAAQESLRIKREEKAKADAAAKEAAKVRIYGLEWDDLAHTRRRAKRADNDEVITFGYLEENKYVVLADSEAAARFREELATAEAEKEAELIASIPVAETPSEPVTPQVPQFPYDETTQAQSSDGLDEEHLGESAQGTSDSPVTREEFEALKAEVYEIKDKLAKPQPAVWAS